MNKSPYNEKFSKTSRDILCITNGDNKEKQKQQVQRLCRMSLQQLTEFVKETMKEVEKKPSIKKSHQSTSHPNLSSTGEIFDILSPIVYNTLNSDRTDSKGFWKEKK